jgi:hypothetical protein
MGATLAGETGAAMIERKSKDLIEHKATAPGPLHAQPSTTGEWALGLASRLLAGAFIVGAGVGAIALAANAPRLVRAARPTLRQGLKRGLEAYHAVRSAAAELADDVEDLLAEVQAELKQAAPPDASGPGGNAKQA